MLFGIANAFPIVGLSVNGDLVQTTLFGAVRILYRDGMWPLAGLVFFTTLLMPLLQMREHCVPAVAVAASDARRIGPTSCFACCIGRARGA